VSELLTLQEAADALGCHYMTLYRRVRGGEVEALLAGGRSRIRRDVLDQWRADRSAREGARGRDVRPRDWHAHEAAVLDLLLAGDAPAARTAVERLVANGADPVDVCELVLAPALTEVGERWHRGTVSVAEEHRASAIVLEVLASIGPAFSAPGRRRGVAVVATPPGNLHGLAPAMVAAALRADRFTVHHLGADVPVDDLVGLAVSVRADVAVLSIALQSPRQEALAASVAGLKALGIPVLVGGRGIDAAGAAAAGANGYGASLRDAQRLAREALAAA
jgi:excisionase family DNA binding protein